MKLTGGKATLVNLSKVTKDYPDHYIIYRDDPKSLAGPIFWLSYLAKERGKSQTGKGTRVYSTLKLSRNTRFVNVAQEARKAFFFTSYTIALSLL